MFFGVYQLDDYHSKACSHRFKIPGEKLTDVNIAVEMVSDAFEDKFDTALLISADDLVAPVKKVRSLCKRVIVAFPPGRMIQIGAGGCGNNGYLPGKPPKSKLSKVVTPQTGTNSIAYLCGLNSN